MRLIDADALKEHIDKLPALPDGNFAGNHSALKALVNMQPTIEPSTNYSESPNGWIPVAERLPENGRQVLAYARSVHYALAKYDEMREADGSYKKQWVTFDAWKPFYTVKDVIAWMPLPEPYKPKEYE